MHTSDSSSDMSLNNNLFLFFLFSFFFFFFFLSNQCPVYPSCRCMLSQSAKCVDSNVRNTGICHPLGEYLTNCRKGKRVCEKISVTFPRSFHYFPTGIYKRFTCLYYEINNSISKTSKQRTLSFTTQKRNA